ncbi:MAG: T9SS type A sorting domain-containing protein [Tannerella sp.]|jgi:poly(3-hydroxybutyrate) depolymerase|nr:T9SS type A sorting domain-containing protein [Tannerella sp.]
MKKKVFTTLILCLLVAGAAAANPERKSIQAGGHMREYLVYMPQNEYAGKPDGIIVALHGFNQTMHNFFEEYSMTSIADSLNCIILSPQALPEQDENVIGKSDVLNLFLDKKIKLDAAWGCGLRVRFFILDGLDLPLTAELNKSVDDVDFIRMAIAQTLNEHAMPVENIYLAGTSMGGYMAYQFAVRQPLKLSGIISIAGSMGLAISGADGRLKTPVCDFHSVTDDVVPYAGSYLASAGVTVSLAKNKEDVIRYWAETNETGTPVTENVDYYPSTNGITAEKITYPHPENEVVHYRINGASHGYFFRKGSGDCMDYVEETGKFIASHFVKHSGGNETVDATQIAVYPNPARDAVYFGCPDGDVSVYDLTGKLVLSASFHSGYLNISSLKQGMHILRIRSGDRTYTAKIIKQ